MQFNLNRIIRELNSERKQLGWKGLFRKRGWRLVLAFFMFYLVRDVIIYIVIPFAAYTGFSNFWPGEEVPMDSAEVVEIRR